MSGLDDLMQQAQAMQEKMQSLQQEVANARVTGESGAGLVRVEMNGRHEVCSVRIDPAVAAEETEVLEDLIAAACNDAVHKVEALQQEKMSSLTGGMSIPGFPFGS